MDYFKFAKSIEITIRGKGSGIKSSTERGYQLLRNYLETRKRDGESENVIRIWA